MSDEIFGPILPVLEYTALDDVVEVYPQASESSCTVSFYRKYARIQNEVLNSISFGGGCINDTIYHFANPHLPFGGVGTSGIGRLSWKEQFLTFFPIKKAS